METEPTLYVHEEHQLIVVHPASGRSAIAARLDVETAPDPWRVSTAFVETAWMRERFKRFPNGAQVLRPSREVLHWYAAVRVALDRFTTLPSNVRPLYNLQILFRKQKEPGHAPRA